MWGNMIDRLVFRLISVESQTARSSFVAALIERQRRPEPYLALFGIVTDAA